MEFHLRCWCECLELCWRVSLACSLRNIYACANILICSIFGTLGGDADFGPAAYSNAVTKRSLGKRNAAVRVL
jgi:hypothetical protein